MSNNRKDPFIELFDLTRLKEIPFLIMKGFLMGSADIVPGVSGGTMALITGIYDRLIFAIKSFDYKALKYALSFNIRDLFNHIHWKFFLFLGSGMVLAVFFFTRVVRTLDCKPCTCRYTGDIWIRIFDRFNCYICYGNAGNFRLISFTDF